ncbi:hypothetical protein Pmani_015937 [Petrolisthes manimaculis]|uniref:Myosin motor domain-containing protein n=1 Tax=Petrolisthes manimaculis TaxID=1843537 RepID=A0AAE1PR73_9EUCA|nr:hypothetical protein Pmani_015937 [Petrolisthes manimaculis]
MYQDGNNSKSRRQIHKGPPPVPPKKPRVNNNDGSGGSSQELSSSESVYSVPREKLLSCEDLTRLPVLYDDIVVECVYERYSSRQFYTWAGPTLVACNPCRPVPQLYTPTLIEHHHQQVKNGVDHRDAHVYSIAGVAHHRLTHHLGSVNQAVLVSGESGAGKTESARYMLGYLTHTETELQQMPKSPLKGVWRDKQPKDIQDKILASNPILEAFGNAATLRNHNSSRFGKLLRLQYGGCQLRGAEIDTYLLEKTRVTHQPERERNFHIFYQVVAGIKAGVLTNLAIIKEQNFAILPEEVTSSDLQNLRVTLSAFRLLEFSENHQQQIFEILAALLQLGNISFIQGDKGNWNINEESVASLKAVCGLLGLNEDHLAESLTIHTISVNSAHKTSVFHKPLERVSQCTERRDAMMQLLYHRLFLHIVHYINAKISAHRTIWSHFIGILDVYGFETFERNSLEQLCINYANERLQQAFMLKYLSAEHQVMKEEGFLGVDIPYTDNSNCVLALDSKISVFTILNEECQLKRAVRESEACERVCKALEHTGMVSAPATPGHTAGFVIRHYAGPVKYDAQGLLHKNKDEVPLEVWGLLTESSCSFMRNIVENSESTDQEKGRRTTRKITTLSKFKSSLDLLMKTLELCDLHYVRCIKPNAGTVTGVVEREYMLHQLKACGVIETVSISQAGYPVRISYEDFIMRYGHTRAGVDATTASIAVAKSVLSPPSSEEVATSLCRFGHTRIFLSESALYKLEEVRKEKHRLGATCLQKYWRSYKCWKQYKNLRTATCIIQKYTKAWVARHSGANSDVGFGLSGESLRAYLSPEHHKRLQETEESGIETDTESINGETNEDSRRVRKLRRRAQLQKLLEERAKATVHRVASEESLPEVTHKPDSYSELDAGVMKSVKYGKKLEIANSDEEVKITKVPVQPQDSYQRMRITTMRNLQEVTSILKGYCPSENLQMVLPKQNLSLYFKDGVLSYRRMPVVGIKFHTRRTCLPFSHHLPHLEQPQGLLDALH